MTIEHAKDRLYDETLLLGVRRRREAIGKLVESADTAGVLALAEALGRGHRDAEAIQQRLRALSHDTDGAKIQALWTVWSADPKPALSAVLAELGWPRGRPFDAKTARDVLAAARAGAAPDVLRAVTVLSRALPLGDGALNDAIHAAWIRSQSQDLGRLIAEQGRQPGSPALKALHALVTGKLDCYAALRDEDGALFAQAFRMAPEPLRARISRVVAANPERHLKEAHRRALLRGAADTAQDVESLKLLGDEDRLFEAVRSRRLMEVLDLCERWAAATARPSGERERAAVERAVTAYRGLGQFRVEPGTELPAGLTDIFDYWREQKPGDADLRADLDAPDPFQKARGLYLGHERGLVDQARLAAAAKSEHWPERLVARLADPALPALGAEDHVMWVSACAGDAALIQAPIDGTPEDYARHSRQLLQAKDAAAAHPRALLEILCAFQGAFVASGITVDESAEATERSAVELDPSEPGLHGAGIMADSGGGMLRQVEPGRFRVEHPLAVNAMDGSVLVYVPAGEFEMGRGENRDCPSHRVELSAYWIGVYAVSNAQYLRFVETTGHRAPDKFNSSSAPGVWQGKGFPAEKADHPVVCVSWEDAQAYAKWAGCELASEAQWEKACRGPLGLAYPSGNEWDEKKCRHCENAGSETTARVYEYANGVSGYGTYNQSGNVWEWCADWYDDNYYGKSPTRDPKGPEVGSYRVNRGGSWRCYVPSIFQATLRGRLVPSYLFDDRGLRLVRAAS